MYVVIAEFEESPILGVFSTYALAEACRDEHFQGLIVFTGSIQEWEVDGDEIVQKEDIN